MKQPILRFLWVSSVGILALVCLCGGIACVCTVSTEPLPIYVGTTLTNPLAYFDSHVDADTKSGHGLRDSYVMTPDAKTVFLYERRFALFEHVIASRTCTYKLDTNGTVVRLDTSGLRWTVLDL